jgi:hypothetical protein
MRASVSDADGESCETQQKLHDITEDSHDDGTILMWCCYIGLQCEVWCMWKSLRWATKLRTLRSEDGVVALYSDISHCQSKHDTFLSQAPIISDTKK